MPGKDGSEPVKRSVNSESLELDYYDSSPSLASRELANVIE